MVNTCMFNLQPQKKFRNNVDLTQNVLREEIDFIRDMNNQFAN